MKATKIMLAVICTLILTWMGLSLLTFLCSGDLTFRQSATHGGVALLMLTFGWIPSVIVSMDLDEKLTH